MKTLYLIRHAKSSWKDLSLKDFERPLNKRGKHDAPFMAKILLKKQVEFDKIISSNALRAKKTTKKISSELNIEKEKIEWNKHIYSARESSLFTMISKIKSKYNTVGLVGHNPELTNLSNILCNEHIYNIPTTGIVEIAFNVERWSEIKEKSGEFISFEYPKKYQEVK